MIDFKNEKRIFTTDAEGSWRPSPADNASAYREAVAAALSGNSTLDKSHTVAGYMFSNSFTPCISQMRALSFRDRHTPVLSGVYEQQYAARKLRNDRRARRARFLCVWGRNVAMAAFLPLLVTWILDLNIPFTIFAGAEVLGLLVFLVIGLMYLAIGEPYTDLYVDEWEWDADVFSEKLLQLGSVIPAEAWVIYGLIRKSVALGDGVDLLVHFRRQYSSPFTDGPGTSRRTKHARNYDYGQLSLRDKGGDITSEITLLMWKTE